MSVDPDDELTRNDRAGGRQLAWLTLFVCLPLIGFAFWVAPQVAAGKEYFLFVVAGGVGLIGALGMRWPHVYIRIAMGRWSELIPRLEDPRHGAADYDATVQVVGKMQEGIPVEIAVAESMDLPPKVLGRIGIAVMLLGATLFVLTCVYSEALIEMGFDASNAPVGCIMLATGGLVMWYRTL